MQLKKITQSSRWHSCGQHAQREGCDAAAVALSRVLHYEALAVRGRAERGFQAEAGRNDSELTSCG